jgi:hypothetical protein
MTLLEIEILMHYHCCPGDYRNGDHSAPAVKEALGWFVDNDLLTMRGFNVERSADGTVAARYSTTERTTAYLSVLQRVPLPTQAWVMPNPWPNVPET